jgi:glycerophosphoryl diester phosphodiesterase
MALFEGIPVSKSQFAHAARANYVGLSFQSATPEFVKTLQSEGFRVMLYDLNDAPSIGIAKAWQPDAIISDFPELI